MSRPSEDDLIATYFAPMAGEGALGLRDDAALLRIESGQDLVVTADAVIGGVHFFLDDPADSIAVKALGVNLSDLAAKGALPTGFVMTLALPSDWSPAWLRAFSDGLARVSAEYACPLLGGDTVRTPGPVSISITAFGCVPRGRMVRRTGARAGDRLYVSGTIGDAALGLKLRADPAAHAALPETLRTTLVDRYLHPQPRTSLAPALLAHAHGGMDVSDGLVGDAAKMLAASGVSGRLHMARIPLSAAARAMVDGDSALLVAAVTGGDDYEVLATVPPEACGSFEDAAARAGVAVTLLGEIENGTAPLALIGSAGEPLQIDQGSFRHF